MSLFFYFFLFGNDSFNYSFSTLYGLAVEIENYVVFLELL